MLPGSEAVCGAQEPSTSATHTCGATTGQQAAVNETRVSPKGVPAVLFSEPGKQSDSMLEFAKGGHVLLEGF